MNIKDIVNRDIVNLENCEQEPIHIPGSIQEHGFLLGLKENTFIIDFCSENCKDYISIPHTQLLAKPFDEAFGGDTLTQLKNYIGEGLMLSSTLLPLTLAGKEFLCTVHNSGGIFIVEAEPPEQEVKSGSQAYNQSALFLNYMHDTHTLKELCALVVKGTREITGYDRVMVYRFDKDYNGEVFAESVRDDLEPFLGLHYPHTDIPPQARELYMQNLLRLITDIGYTPVPIYTVDDNENKNLDLSMSVLRSTSPMHVQYLHNMGVGATLTISLIHQKKLWGLIACHHYSKKNLTPEVRLAAQLQGHFITSQIQLRQTNEEYEVVRKTGAALENLNKLNLASGADAFKELITSPDLLSVCNASGVSIFYNGTVYMHGLTPSEAEINFLSNWLTIYTSNSNLSTDKMIDILDHQNICRNTAGVVYHSLDAVSSNCIIWYRPETKTEVNWAGDPNKAIVKDKDGLSPRNSFKLWKEVVDCMSKPWLQPELNAAAAYAQSLQKQINLITIIEEEEKYRKLSELLKQTNSELENINWISTHDLQEPLRKIQLISSRMLVKEEDMPETVQDSVKRMNTSANRMQTLLVDILKYTRLKHTDGQFEDVDLNSIMDDVKNSLSETLQEQSVNFIADSLPVVKGVPFLLEQLFSNLISNSVKYSTPGKIPSVKVTAEHQPVHHPSAAGRELYHLIYVVDNGIGFEQGYAESIFNIFTRLHASSEYKGSGVGLALCKKIMQNHQGHISASSQPGEGTAISLYFPV
ncbi:MAG: GAF domain-containing protein [Flavobacterium sp.]|nr:MAG: GAF domain-containing protein [Flavobacterium sp.]